MGNIESCKIRHACGPKGCGLRPTALCFTGFFLLVQIIVVAMSIVPLIPAHAQTLDVERRSYHIYFVFTVVYLNLYIAAFVGIYKRIRVLLLPWLLIHGSVVVLIFLTASVFFIVIEYWLIAIPVGLLNLYHWVLIHSYYHTLSLDYVGTPADRL